MKTLKIVVATLMLLTPATAGCSLMSADSGEPGPVSAIDEGVVYCDVPSQRPLGYDSGARATVNAYDGGCTCTALVVGNVADGTCVAADGGPYVVKPLWVCVTNSTTGPQPSCTAENQLCSSEGEQGYCDRQF